MNTALLRGRDHTLLGAVATVAEGGAAIALSRGGARKTYAHKDPNEDCVGFARGEGGVLLVVADGHGGQQAAEIAVERVLAGRAADWTSQRAPDLHANWEQAARDALLEVANAIVHATATGAPETTRTTLAFALVRPGDDLLAWASIGDSHVFVVGEQETIELAAPERTGSVFLGHPAETADSLPPKCVVGRDALCDARAVVLVTDGISEHGIGVDVPETSVAEAVARARGADPELVPLVAARGVVDEALAAHRRHGAGDNVASAVAWLGGAL